MSEPLTTEQISEAVGKELGHIWFALAVIAREIAKQPRIDSAIFLTGVVDALTPARGAEDHFEGLRAALMMEPQ
jgi:hypothetical protein